MKMPGLFCLYSTLKTTEVDPKYFLAKFISTPELQKTVFQNT